METLREKLGPLPVWAWLALLTAAGAAWWLISRRKGTAPASAIAANDVPDTVIQATVNEPPDEDTDRERHRKRKAAAHKCPAGYVFMPVPRGSDIWPAGGRQVAGGFCVPDRRQGITQPVLPNPRVPPAGREPTNHEPKAA